jgi:hypothetical protein
MTSIVKKVMLVGKTTTFMMGLAVILALTVGLASTALAGTGVGARFDLGKTNTVNAVTKLVGSVAGPSLQVDNNSTNAAATALDLQVEPGKAPMKVNSDAQVVNLNSDKLDNLDSSAFFRSTYIEEKATDSNGTGSPGALDPIFCDAGDFAMGGGYSAVDSGTQIIMNRPHSSGEGWAVSWRNGATVDTIVVHVVCADVGTPHQQ